jgi:cyclic beta-1,2-glucan synthetase
MSVDPPSPEGSARLVIDPRCPALNPTARWDEPATLRGEILLAEQLVEHAAELARVHGEPSRAVATDRLWRRFLSVRKQIHEAYGVLTARLLAGQDPSPAEEWLLENSHVVEDQIREIHEDLPRGYRAELSRLSAGAMRGHPRVYALCLDYLRHTDARLDLTTLVQYVESYQRLHVLTIGELWAVPIMLRLGLVLTVGALAASEAKSGNRERADAWAERVLAARRSAPDIEAVLREIERDRPPISAPFLVQLARRLRESDDPSLVVAFDWLATRSHELGASPEELARLQHLKQAADQVSVGNAITSMRTVGALDWNSFFERTSAVEALLRKDPVGTYAVTDKVTRDRYRHAVEGIARRASGGEFGIARSALALAAAAHGRDPSDVKRAHVGYYLVDAGRPALERAVSYRPRLGQRGRRLVLDHPGHVYFGLLSVLTLAGVALAGWAVHSLLPPGAEPWPALVAGILALVPASEVALALTQSFVTWLLEPRLLPRLDFEQGIPADCRTLVAVPCLLDSRSTVESLLEDLEVRSLANEGKYLHFALLTDFRDADTETEPNDEGLLEAARAGIARLNERYPDVPHRYWLLHRRRLHNPNEGRFMGWERKRGKLEELNRLLRGATDTSYTCVDAPAELLRTVRYVITLDVDTGLPRETARAMVATIAHPLNRAELDPQRQRVVHGYGIVQPRVGALPLSARQSLYAALSTGPSGIDPYTTAVSDVYQDLFGEGSYTGKAIYDVDAFATALEGRSPENILLSHDLFESFFARSALATDIELLDEQPAAYAVHAGRQHRWMRGDWQLLPWLLPSVPGRRGRRKNDLRLLDRWKLFDNLRRSCLPPAIVLSLAVGWIAGGALAFIASASLLLVLLFPALVQAVLSLSRDASGKFWTPFVGLGGNVVRGALNALLDAVFMLDQALLSVDAIGAALYRSLRKKKTLEWTTMRQSSAGAAGGVSLRMIAGSLLAIGGGVALTLTQSDALLVALPVLVAWAVAPLVAVLLSRPLGENRQEDLLSAEDRLFLRRLARKTWRFFHHFVNADEHYLPPDNYQEEPRGVIAHRTSPTNIGLYLLSTLSAHDFGFVTSSEVVERINATLDTLDRLPRKDGHLLNWYNTETLAPLPPEYVSTVDSGNLAAYLWTLASAGPELRSAPIVGDAAYRSIADALELSCEAMGSGVVATRAAPLRALARELRATSGPRSLAEDASRLVRVRELIGRELPSARDLPVEARYWLVDAERCALARVEELGTLAPFVALLETSPLSDATDPTTPWGAVRAALSAPTTVADVYAASQLAQELLEELDETSDGSLAPSSPEGRLLSALAQALEQSRHRTSTLLDAVDRTVSRCRALADGMSFRFLLDETRELFSTGYNVSNARLDSSHYDLLASEARLASLVAIAKGDAPQKHWFRLARPRTRVDGGRALLSWSGSMFEYLMPLLVTECRPGTLLAETSLAAVRQQRNYGAKQHVPWGISESAYNVMDLEMTYQYRAFGVPGLGLKVGLAEDLVVTPYATALAALVDPVAAVKNFRSLSLERLAGQFGYFEAIDYSPSRTPPGKRGVVVKSFMAHHLGMTLVALGNVIHDRAMQRRFHADPRIKASELLLEERIPTGAPLLEVPEAALAAPARHAPDLDASEHVRLEDGIPTRAHLLGHGALSTLVTSTGSGALTWKGMDVNRFREDAVFDPGGIYAYVRNLTSHGVWSAGYYPARRSPDAYDAAFFIDRVEIRRRDGALETITEIVPSAEHAAEVRRFTLTNHGDEACEVELTTFTELSLAPRAADRAHRAFSTMFVETEALPEHGAVIAHRRPREPEEPAIWVGQVLTSEDELFGAIDYDTSRPHFIGRSGSLERPRALRKYETRLAGKTGTVLDPAFALRRTAKLAAGASARVTLTTVMADTREELLHLIANYAAPQAIPRAFELGLADARVELRHLGVTAVQAHRFQRVLSVIVFPQAALRAAVDVSSLSGGESALWARGVSGTLPIVVLRVDHPDFDDLFRELLLAQEYFRINGVSVDLVVLNDEPSVYLQPMQEHALEVVHSVHAEGRMDQPGGIFLRRTDQMSEGDQRLLLSAARAVFSASAGSLSRQLKRGTRRPALPEPLTFGESASPRRSLPPPARPELLFDNGLGGFTPDGREYRMRLDRERRTPLAWCNVLANPSFGVVVTEQGSTFTWSKNCQRHRLSAWSNDPLLDPSGEAVYVRDDEDGFVWSATPRPSGGSAEYQVAHGQGYTRFTHSRGGLAHELTVFVSARDPVRFQRLRIENRSDQPRRLSVFGVVEWVLGQHRERSGLSVQTTWDGDAHALFATSPFTIAPHATAFFSVTAPVRSFTADRAEFFGSPGSRRFPHALRRARLSGRAGSGLDPCAALETSITLPPGETFVVTFALGEGAGPEQARELALAYTHDTAVARALEEVHEQWERLLGTVTVSTPDPALDVLMNRWVPYQTLACRLWARGAFYQSGGAYGYRDQLQDSLALMHVLPNIAREQILRCAARQFVEGDVQHWWHPEAGDGVRTRCSDDKLWLPYAVVEYLRVTEDRALLEETVPFLGERALLPEEHDLYSTPSGSPEAAPLYEHCARALDSALVVGAHGLPRIGSGDWNDGMNRIGLAERGESVWLAWFLVKALRDFAPLAQARRETNRATRWLEHARRLTEAVDAHAWDGAWYRRAYFDDGSPVGSAASPECRIDAIAQSWAVIAGTGDPRRAAAAVLASERLLVDEGAGLMALLAPPFTGTGPDPGYIASYPAGVRENGGQYTHGALFTLRALAMLGDNERVERLLTLLNPVRHALTPEAVERYRVEPYVIAADVYSAPEHLGRGGWTWYTGSAGWFYRVVLEDVLGFRRQGNRVTLNPCLPASWPKAELAYRYGRSTLRIVIENARGEVSGEDALRVDGRSRSERVIELVDDGRTHDVKLRVGERRLLSSA